MTETQSAAAQNDCPALVSFSQTASEYARVFCYCQPLNVSNPSFETTDVAWQPYGDGFSYTTVTASDGLQSIAVTNGGALQFSTLPAG